MNTTQPGHTKRKLYIGCGNEPKEGWTNLDIADLPGVDVVHDITKLPLPFEDGSFDEILCKYVLEHLQEWAPVLGDIHRIMAPGGQIRIDVPHFTSKQNFNDPTHRRLFSIETFDWFIPGKKSHDSSAYYFTFTFSKIAHRKITFELTSRWFFYNKFIERWVNKSSWRQIWFESTFLSRLFPAHNLEFVLVK